MPSILYFILIFRLSISENQDVNLDAILGELCELESQLNTTQSELSARASVNRGITDGITKDDNRDSGNDFVQAELDALAAEISRGIQFQDDYCAGLNLDQSYLDPTFDIGETDSAFSDNTSLPSSESFTSMVTVSSSADTSSSGDSCSTNSTSTLTPNVNPAFEVRKHPNINPQLESCI